MISGGIDYAIDSAWTVRTGVAFDQGAVKDKQHRTARVPDNNRWIVSLGGSYVHDRWQFDLSCAHMFLQTAKAYNKNGSTILDAKYTMGINLVGASVQYNF